MLDALNIIAQATFGKKYTFGDQATDIDWVKLAMRKRI